MWQPGRGGMSTGMGAVPMAVGWKHCCERGGKELGSAPGSWAVGLCILSLCFSSSTLGGFSPFAGVGGSSWGLSLGQGCAGSCGEPSPPHPCLASAVPWSCLTPPGNSYVIPHGSSYSLIFLESSLISLIMPPRPSSASFPAEVFACGGCLSPLTSTCPSVFQVSPFLCPLSSCSFLFSLALGASLSPLNSRNVCAGMNLCSLPSQGLGQAGQIRALAGRELLGWV